MAYVLKTNLANKANYGSKRSTANIKYIVVHYTSNDGDTDENNGKYYKNNVVKASAHYFVDDDSVTQSVPDNYTAWSVGGKKYSDCAKKGGGTLHGKCTNANSISVEICDDVKNGVVYPSEKTIENALVLVKALMKKYDIPASNVIRHFDVTGKYCPAYWSATDEKNAKWKTEFWNKLSDTSADKASDKTSDKASDKKVSDTNMPTIKYGSTGKAVKIVQVILGVTVDGDFGKNTLAAVKAFQKKKGLEVDGIVGANTWKALLESV